VVDARTDGSPIESDTGTGSQRCETHVHNGKSAVTGNTLTW
jgi:hypothetical protein